MNEPNDNSAAAGVVFFLASALVLFAALFVLACVASLARHSEVKIDLIEGTNGWNFAK